MPNNVGGPGNPDPNKATRFGKGNKASVPGRKNRTTIGKEFAAKEGLTEQQRPLAFFIAMMKGDPFTVREERLVDGKVVVKTRDYYPTVEDMKWGAAMAAPYMHPKLAHIEHTGDVTVHHEDLIDQLLNEDNAGERATRH